MADNPLPGTTRFAMGAQQRGRVDFETACRIGGNIARRHRVHNAAGHTDQQPAAFATGRRCGLGQKGFVYPPCNFDDRADIG